MFTQVLEELFSLSAGKREVKDIQVRTRMVNNALRYVNDAWFKIISHLSSPENEWLNNYSATNDNSYQYDNEHANKIDFFIFQYF